jgi:hypothetical protein
LCSQIESTKGLGNGNELEGLENFEETPAPTIKAKKINILNTPDIDQLEPENDEYLDDATFTAERSR